MSMNMSMNDNANTASGVMPKRTGYWPLRTDSRDLTEFGRHGRAENITYKDAAIFDGESSFIALPDVPETDGGKPFTVSLEFKVEDEAGKLPGGLFSRYDDQSRAGWHLSVLTQAGVTMSQANWRNLQFGWSSGNSKDEWRDRGAPGNSRFISSMCVHDGSLYVGTFDDAADSIGRVYRLAKDDTWENCGNPDKSNCVVSLLEWNGRLYAGSMRYRAGGSHMQSSVNHEPGGRIYRYEGDQTWSLFAELPVKIDPDRPAYDPNSSSVYMGRENDSVGAMTVYQNHLIAMSFYPYGIFAFDVDGNVKDLGAPGPLDKTRTFTLTQFRGRLYVGCNETAGVYSRTLETPWEFNGIVPYCDQVYSFAAYQNELMMGIWREGRMYKYMGGIAWTDCGLLGEELEVMGVSVFNGQLYAGTLPGGQVYRYKGGTAWELSGVLEQPSSETDYCRVWSMAVCDGELFAGTLPSGKVWSLKNDPLAMDSRALTDGWHKATAVYDQKSLSLYLDGQLVSTADIDADSPIQPQSQIPLIIGQGPQCRFSGRIREVELFDAALTPEQVADEFARKGKAPTHCFYCSDEYKDYMKEVALLEYARVYLNNEQEYPGRCYVVLNSHKTELYELDDEELAGFMNDVARVADAVNKVFKPDKINYAVYGDIDSHVHFHVVPKRKDGKCWGWPFELTGEEGKKKYLTAAQYDETVALIRQYLL